MEPIRRIAMFIVVSIDRALVDSVLSILLSCSVPERVVQCVLIWLVIMANLHMGELGSLLPGSCLLDAQAGPATADPRCARHRRSVRLSAIRVAFEWAR